MANTYAGIDYGLGQSNIDRETGIRYGVISQHSVGQAWYDGAEADYGKAHCPKCGNEIGNSSEVEQDAEWNDGKDFACAECQECFWSDACYSDEALGYSYQDAEYTLTDCLDSDIFVLKSPYFTYAQFCSPCVPGACNLNSPLDVTFTTGDWTVENELAAQARGNNKCYALGHEWFEDGKAPYRVWRVADGMEVQP